ncbi:hypothetical protein AALP_AA2G042200 [Arabis alpina]|uniref:Replication protein A 70 kDa DNA-binding subunit B/D first OB fold domain-containing protein n=1 Tax=Arabis alpina TaxID=50452 RepID=A0A087HF95_ARAAL|nr:hypothetical protein AALP_AA2G042200 [Arabis alpina]
MLPQHTVSELDRYKTGWRIRVKVLRKRYRYKANFIDTLQLILCDDQGTKIHATVLKEHLRKFQDILCESEWRIITFFTVRNAIGISNVVRNNNMIEFLEGTIVDPTNYVNGDHFFCFVDFESILRVFPLRHYLIDLIGRIIHVGDTEEVYHSGNGHYIGQLCFTLANKSNTRIKCIAYGDKAYAIKDSLDNAVRDEIDMCILRWWQIDIISGTDVHSYEDCSEILFNPPIEEAARFRERGIDLNGGD